MSILGLNYQPPAGYTESLARIPVQFHISKSGIAFGYRDCLDGFVHFLARCRSGSNQPIIHSLGPLELERVRGALSMSTILMDTGMGDQGLDVVPLLQTPGLITGELIGPGMKDARIQRSPIQTIRAAERRDSRAFMQTIGAEALGFDQGDLWSHILSSVQRLYLAGRS